MQARTAQTSPRTRRLTGTERVVKLVNQRGGVRSLDEVSRILTRKLGPGPARQAINFSILARYVTVDSYGDLHVEEDDR